MHKEIINERKISSSQQRNLHSNIQIQNRARINFACKNQKQQSKFQERYNDLVESNQQIDPWDTAFHKQEFYKGILKTKAKQPIKAKRFTNNHFINRASVTTRSWNAERERLFKLRKQLPMAVTKFEEQNQTFFSEQKNIICYFKRKKQQQTQSSKEKDNDYGLTFNKHRNILSRIYSHSVDPKIIIRGYSPSNIETYYHFTFEQAIGQEQKVIINSSKNLKKLHIQQQAKLYNKAQITIKSKDKIFINKIKELNPKKKLNAQNNLIMNLIISLLSTFYNIQLIENMSKTQTKIQTEASTQPEENSPNEKTKKNLIIKLQDKSKPRVTWTEDTIDNQHMNKMKSNLCCIYHRPGQSSSDTCTSDDQGNALERDRHTKHLHKKKCSKNKNKGDNKKEENDNKGKQKCGGDTCGHKH